MVSTEVSELTFEGTKSEKALAKEVLSVIAGRGQFMAADAPIRVEVDQLVEYLKATQKKVSGQTIPNLVELNPDVFSIVEEAGQTFIVASRLGRTPSGPDAASTHSFHERLMTPEPRPERLASTLRPRPRGDSTWSTLDRVLSDFKIGEGDHALRRMMDAEAAAIASNIVDDEVGTPAAIESVAEQVPVAEVEALLDVSGMGDKELAGAVSIRLSQDSRVAHFGDHWMFEDLVPRLSRGDLRRIKDYIEEQEQPLTDDVLVQDVLEVRQKSSDFEVMRFALNFRLASEHRDFEFVGTNDQRFWSVSNLPPIGTNRRKATEIGADYRFMLEELPAQPAYRSVSQISHVMSFYEFYLGLLPYDPEIQALLPAPLVSGQRSAVLTFECPQSYTTYLVELRYPTPNRGGFLLGLDDFFNENLVPGALLSIKATENDGHFIVEFEESDSQSHRLLELEDRRQRYVFRPTSFNCQVFEDYLLDEARFPGFSGDKPMDEKGRKKAEAVVSKAFERRGNELEGGGFGATFAELLAASNTERPFSESFLRQVLDGDESGAFAPDPDRNDAFTYIPGSLG
ncbi:hypothetical protein BH23CHL5_BH23CHL5_03810 [soil metagenome]